MTVGNTMAWDATLRVLCERGDYILTEEYAFASALETAAPLGIRIAGVKMDEQGLLPEICAFIQVDTLSSTSD